MMSASSAAAATMAGVHATPSAARDTAPLPEGVRAGDDVGLKGGVGDGGRRAATPSAARDTAPLLEGVRAGDNVDQTGRGGDDSRTACAAGGCARHGASPGRCEDRR